MRLTQVSITNYRALRECNFKLSPFTCIVGENNAGKSTVLLALSLFFSGTRLTSSEYYNSSQPIKIEVTFEDITSRDMNRITTEENRERIQELIYEGKLKLVRKYFIDGNSDLFCVKRLPTDSRFDIDSINGIMRGQRGNALNEAVKAHLPEYSERFNGATTQSAIKEIINQIINEMDASQLTEKEQPLPTGIPNSIKSLLPEPILIPAFKDVTDDIKTKESATFGKLISILLKDVESAEEVQHIIKSFGELQSLLNITKLENGEVIDNRLTQVQHIETLISGFLQESFPKVRLELRIPPPQLKQVFSNAEILIDDGVQDLVETKGDGLKRSVTFALLRSYAEKRRKPIVAEEQDIVAAPYLFLFEEPELYLHPSAQRVLFDALGKISSEHQIVVTTHSPLFFSPDTIGTFIKFSKTYPEGEKPFGCPISINLLDNIAARDAFQIICFENNSAAFFANKVVLVEGDSDLCYFKHVSKVLNSEWDFDARNIPVVRIYGKGNVRRCKEFFASFNMSIYTIIDLDVIISDFDKLGVSPSIEELRANLLQEVDRIAERETVDGTPSREKIKDIVRRYSWRERYERLKALCSQLITERQLNSDEIEEINLLFSEETEIKRKQILVRGMADVPGKNDLLNALRQENVFVLSRGTVEDYYPSDVLGDDKPSKALNVCKRLLTRESVLENCPIIRENESDIHELLVIFEKIFN